VFIDAVGGFLTILFLYSCRRWAKGGGRRGFPSDKFFKDIKIFKDRTSSLFMVEKKKVPIWAWIVMAVLVILLFYSDSQKNKVMDLYEDSALQDLEGLKEQISSTEDFINLLICYQENSPTCDVLNEKYPEGNGEVFRIK
jgi:hypothetical protein